MIFNEPISQLALTNVIYDTDPIPPIFSLVLQVRSLLESVQTWPLRGYWMICLSLQLRIYFLSASSLFGRESIHSNVGLHILFHSVRDVGVWKKLWLQLMPSIVASWCRDQLDPA